MDNTYLEAGRIVNTHGVRGEVKIDPWEGDPHFLASLPTLYVDGKPLRVLRARVHQRFVIAALEGVDTLETAEKLKTRTVSIDRADAKLPEGAYFIADLIGFAARDEAGNALGTVTDVLTKPGGDILEIHGDREILVPLVPAFVVGRDMEAKTLTLRLIEGM